MNKQNEKIIAFGLICSLIGIIGLLTMLGIAIATMGTISICIYICILLIIIGVFACNFGSNNFKHQFEM